MRLSTKNRRQTLFAADPDIHSKVAMYKYTVQATIR
jgi:hypothetical protein